MSEAEFQAKRREMKARRKRHHAERNTPEYHLRLTGAWEYTPEAAKVHLQALIDDHLAYPSREESDPLY